MLARLPCWCPVPWCPGALLVLTVQQCAARSRHLIVRSGWVQSTGHCTAAAGRQLWDAKVKFILVQQMRLCECI